MRNIRNIQDVVDWRLCTGCGACAPACPRAAIDLQDIPSEGIRPRIDAIFCRECSGCEPVLGVCPGWQVDAGLMTGPRPRATDCDVEFGPALEVWEGYAADPEIRYQGSSGAVLTALALYCLEREGMEFALHVGADAATPWRNRTVTSRTREELLGRAGSRYAPASPCEGLDLIARSPRPCVFIGKPCDAAAAAMSCSRRPDLQARMGAILTFFCAGTPSTQGTLNLLKSLGVDADETETLRYRGQGWPGRFQVRCAGRGERSLSYEDSWDNLNRYRPFRCHLCPDGLGRVADLSCGDAWHRHQPGDGDPGRSIVLVRTPVGQALLRGALKAGYVVLKPLDPRRVLMAQRNLLERRHHLFGRLLALQMMLTPKPRFRGFSLARSWLALPPATMARTIVGTLRRIVTRGLWRRRVEPEETEMKPEECEIRNE